MAMKLFIGDVHGELERLRQALDFANTLSINEIFCTGDLFKSYRDHQVDESAIISVLTSHGVQTIRGNHDDWYLERQPDGAVSEFIASLPYTRDVELPGGTALFCHGIGKRTMAKVRNDDYGYALESNFELWAVINSGHYRFLVNGHTHHQMTRVIEGLRIINAGAICHDDSGIVLLDEDSMDVWWLPFAGGLEAAAREKPWFNLGAKE
jgi:predicted phosphodiesterase